ncbi:MAG: hypothetical protein LBH93_07555 [Chitinispirillales bacterium]|jgi:hypothetical protein|nr:hypothetical protein [Chitinispirillales bacterium]
MNERELSTLIWLRVRDIVKMFLAQDSVSASEAFSLIYKSRVFELLSNEKTKVWHYSAHMLYYLLQTEIQTGKVDLPENQS